MTCPACGANVDAAAKFCSECGASQNEINALSVTRPYTRIERWVDDAKAAGQSALGSDIGREVVRATEMSVAAGQTALKSDLGANLAKGAAFGAVIAIPIPFVGPVVGAAVGAGIVAFRRFTR